MPRYPFLSPVYTIFQDYLNRCLLADRSLLWPEREVWTITNLEHLRRRFVEGFIQGRGTFREKLEAQLGGAPAEVWALAADSLYLYGLPSRTIRFATKKGLVEWAARQAGLDLPGEDDALWEPLRLGFAGTGQKYNLKHAQLRLLTLLALEVKASPDPRAAFASPSALQSLLDAILDGIPLRIDRAYDMRNAILYMAFPDSYEPLLANRDKDAILKQYRPLVKDALPDDRDAALRQVREALAPRFVEQAQLGEQIPSGEQIPPFDFYTDLRDEWKPAPLGLEKAIAAQIREEQARYAVVAAGLFGREPSVDKPVDKVESTVPEEDALADVQAPSHLIREVPEPWRSFEAGEDDPDARRVLAALRLTRNVILVGPPGTGKTYLAARAARRIVDTPIPDDFIWWVTLHPSYSYEDFVEGLRPVLSAENDERPGGGPPVGGPGIERGTGDQPGSGAIAYQVRPGVFRQVCERATADPTHPYVLVIDEINRGHLSTIMGELITLIEDDKRGRYSARLPYSGRSFSVPPNLILLGTMNTADRSVALLDVALRRRFAFVEIGPRPDLLAGAPVETEEAVLHLDVLLRCLNAAVADALGRDHLIGHSYFLRVAQSAAEERLSVLELVWNNQVLPLLEEYFYAQKERLAELLAPFFEDSVPADPYDLTNPAEAARLAGEDLVVALSRLCEGGRGY